MCLWTSKDMSISKNFRFGVLTLRTCCLFHRIPHRLESTGMSALSSSSLPTFSENGVGVSGSHPHEPHSQHGILRGAQLAGLNLLGGHCHWEGCGQWGALSSPQVPSLPRLLHAQRAYQYGFITILLRPQTTLRKTFPCVVIKPWNYKLQDHHGLEILW